MNRWALMGHFIGQFSRAAWHERQGSTEINGSLNIFRSSIDFSIKNCFVIRLRYFILTISSGDDLTRKIQQTLHNESSARANFELIKQFHGDLNVVSVERLDRPDPFMAQIWISNHLFSLSTGAKQKLLRLQVIESMLTQTFWNFHSVSPMPVPWP